MTIKTFFPQKITSASSTEILGPSDTFSSSFDLPSPSGFSFGCAAEVEPGVVFVSGGELYQEQAYLVDVSTGAGIRLQDLPAGRARHSCGAIRSGVRCGTVVVLLWGDILHDFNYRGTEVVVAGGDAESTTDIFNLDLQAWRPGMEIAEEKRLVYATFFCPCRSLPPC